MLWTEETSREVKEYTKDKAWCERPAFLSEVQHLALDSPLYMADVQNTESISRGSYSAEARRKTANSHHPNFQYRKVICLRPERNYISENQVLGGFCLFCFVFIRILLNVHITKMES